MHVHNSILRTAQSNSQKTVYILNMSCMTPKFMPPPSHLCLWLMNGTSDFCVGICVVHVPAKFHMTRPAYLLIIAIIVTAKENVRTSAILFYVPQKSYCNRSRIFSQYIRDHHTTFQGPKQPRRCGVSEASQVLPSAVLFVADC